MRAAVRGLVRPVLGPRMPVSVQRRWLDLVTGLTPLAAGVDVRPGDARRPPGRGDGAHATARPAHVLYLHGGGFTIGSARTHRALATHLAPRAGPPCTCSTTGSPPSTPSRRRSTTPSPPTGTAGGGADPARTALAGDSAGGWLALTARAPAPGRRRPAARRPRPRLPLAGPAPAPTWPADRSDAMLRAVLAAPLRRRLRPRRRPGRARVRPAGQGPRRSPADGRARRQRGDPAARRRPAGRARSRPRACRSSCAGGTGSGTSRTRPPAWWRRRRPPSTRWARAWRPGWADVRPPPERRLLVAAGRRAGDPRRPVLAANTNSRRGSCSCPRETTSRRKNRPASSRRPPATLRLNVGTRLTW